MKYLLLAGTVSISISAAFLVITEAPTTVRGGSNDRVLATVDTSSVPISSDDCDPASPTRVEIGKLGEKIYHWSTSQGDTVQVVPPADFDLSSASPDVLRELKIPDRPTDPEQLANWVKTFSNAAHEVLSDVCTPASDLPHADVSNSGYGGVTDSPSSGHPYRGAYGTNRVFVSQPNDCSSGKGETSWVGVQSQGSVNGGSGLLQAGTYRLNGPVRIFYESITPNNSQISGPMFLTNFPLSEGDLVYYFAEYYPASQTGTGSPEVDYQWVNYSQGNSFTSKSISLNPSYFYWDGGFANFIDEKFGAYQFQRSPNIGWKDAFVVGNGPGNYPGNLPVFFYQIVNNHLDMHMDGGLQSVSNWTDFWKNCD